MEQSTNLCHACKYGGQVVERCAAPDLTERGIMPKRVWKNTILLSAAHAVAEAKGIENFSPLPYVAVVAAVVRGQCRYYEAQE